MIKTIKKKIEELEELRKQCKLNADNSNLSDDIREYSKGYYVALREEIKYLKELIKILGGFEND